MKKIINNKLYDTDTSTLIYDVQEGYINDYHYLRKRLFITKNGAYFTVEEGGAGTCYRESDGYGNYTSRRILSSLTREEAFESCAEYATTDITLQYFPDMIEEA